MAGGGMNYVLVLIVGFIAGVQNALAGGGSFLTFPALLVFGMGARAANITSTVALFPGQVATGLAGRRDVAGIEGFGFRALAAISLVGGAIGAVLLLLTSESFFAHLVPFLVLFATGVFAWGSFMRRPATGGPRVGRMWAGIFQGLIAIYGGYFGGGIGILMLAALSLAGLQVHAAGATKNALAGILNLSAVVIFAFSRDVHWFAAIATGAGAIAGGQLGAWMMRRVNERWLRGIVIAIGLLLTGAMFWKVYVAGK
jgi:uncharacterized membrane protein YfcA